MRSAVGGRDDNLKYKEGNSMKESLIVVTYFSKNSLNRITRYALHVERQGREHSQERPAMERL